MDSKLMILNEPDGQTLYNLSNAQFSIEKSDAKTKVYHAPDNNSNFNTCIRLGTSKTNCQNRIQFVAINNNEVIGCGSAALVPTCYVFNDKNEVLSEFPASGLISDNAVDQPLTKVLRKMQNFEKNDELNILSVAYDRASVAAIHLVQIKADQTTGNMHSKTIKTHKFTSNENTNEYQTIVEYKNNLIVVGSNNQNKGISYRLCRNDPGTIQDSNQFSRILKSYLACKHDGVTFNNLIATRSSNNNIVGLFKNDYGTETAVCLFPFPDFTSGSSSGTGLDCQNGQLTQNAAATLLDSPEAIQNNAIYVHSGLIDNLTIHQEDSSEDFTLYLFTSDSILKKTIISSKLYHNHVINENPFSSGATVVRWKNHLRSSLSEQLPLEHCVKYMSCHQCFASYDLDCQQFNIESQVCQRTLSPSIEADEITRYEDCPESNNSKLFQQNIDQGSYAVLPISIVENNLQLADRANWYFENNLIDDDDQKFSATRANPWLSLTIYSVDENTFGSYSLDVTQNDRSIFSAYFEVNPTVDGISDHLSGNRSPSPIPPVTDFPPMSTENPTTIRTDSNLVPETAGVPFLLFILVIALLIGLFSVSLAVFICCIRSKRKGKLVVMGPGGHLGERSEPAGAENVDDVFKDIKLEIEPMLKSGIESGIQSDLNLADSIDHTSNLHETDTRNSPNGQSNSTEYYSCRSSSESYNSPNGTMSKNLEDVIIWCPKNNTLKRISYDKLLKHENDMSIMKLEAEDEIQLKNTLSQTLKRSQNPLKKSAS